MTISANAQLFESDKIWVSGRIYEFDYFGKDSLSPAYNVNVIDLNSYTGTTSDRQGFFSIRVDKGDTLIFSSVKLKKDSFFTDPNDPNNEVFIKVVLQPANYHLKGVNVYGKDYAGFKYDFLHMESDTIIISLATLGIPNGGSLVGPQESFGVTMYGPFTQLWQKFSKQGKELAKLASILEADRKQNFLDSAYKRKVVLNFLDMDEEEVETFIDYCALDPEFIKKSTDYEFLTALNVCLEAYRREGY